MKSKKSQFGSLMLVSILSLFLGAVITGIWIYDISTKECKSNSECGDNNYCGGDHTCHVLSVIEESSSIMVTQKNFGVAGFIMGVSIIISSLILTYGKKWIKNLN